VFGRKIGDLFVGSHHHGPFAFPDDQSLDHAISQFARSGKDDVDPFAAVSLFHQVMGFGPVKNDCDGMMFEFFVGHKTFYKGVTAVLETLLLNDAEGRRLPDQVVAVYDDVEGHGDKIALRFYDAFRRVTSRSRSSLP